MVLSAETTNGATSTPLSVTGPVPYPDTKPSRNPFPPIADYAFLSDCENTCLISLARLGGVAVRAAARFAQRVRRDPGPRRRAFPAGPVRRLGAGGPALSARAA